MRTLALAFTLALAPSLAAAQLAPRSLALEVGIAWDSAGDRVPVALAASWWIAERLDLTARVGWASAPRTEGREADGIFEAGLGLRRALGDGPLRTALLAEVGSAQVLGASLFERDLRIRVRAGIAFDAFVLRDLAVGLALLAGGTLSPSTGEANGDVGLALRAEGFF
jgi:hypothetical protein